MLKSIMSLARSLCLVVLSAFNVVVQLTVEAAVAVVYMVGQVPRSPARFVSKTSAACMGVCSSFATMLRCIGLRTV